MASDWNTISPFVPTAVAAGSVDWPSWGAGSTVAVATGLPAWSTTFTHSLPNRLASTSQVSDCCHSRLISVMAFVVTAHGKVSEVAVGDPCGYQSLVESVLVSVQV